MITDSVKTTLPADHPPVDSVQPDDWTLDIQAKYGLFDLDVKELWRYRDLVGLVVRRDFVSAYKQTVLGPLWHLTEPLVTTLMYAFIFGTIAKISTDGLPRILFYLPGIMLWSFFSNGLLQTSATFNTNSGIFGKVYFPRLVMPIATVISTMIALGLQFGLFLSILAFYAFKGAAVRVTGYALLTPALVLITAGLALGLGTLLSSVTTKYRDLQKLLNVSIRLLMFATPVIYPLSQVSGSTRSILLLNPMTMIVESFRYAWLGSGTFSWGGLAYSAAVMVVVLAGGVLVFNRAEKVAMDSV